MAFKSYIEMLANSLLVQRAKESPEVRRALSVVNFHPFSQDIVEDYAKQAYVPILLNNGGNCGGLCVMHASLHQISSNTALPRLISLLGSETTRKKTLEKIAIAQLCQPFGFDLNLKTRLDAAQSNFEELLPDSLKGKKYIGLTFKGLRANHVISIIRDEAVSVSYRIFDSNIGEISGLTSEEVLLCLKHIKNYYGTFKNELICDLEKYSRRSTEINITDQTLGFTPLLTAVRSGNERTVRFLMQHGADINQLGRFGISPLDYALYSGAHEIAELLRAKNAKHRSAFIGYVSCLLYDLGVADIFDKIFIRNVILVSTMIGIVLLLNPECSLYAGALLPPIMAAGSAIATVISLPSAAFIAGSAVLAAGLVFKCSNEQQCLSR